jgi:hypothetical protein
MKNLITVISLIVVSVTASFAQADANYKASLKTMLQAAGSEESFKVAIKQMFDMYKNQSTNVPDSVWSGFENEFLRTSIDQLVDMLAPVYQKHMTEDDLKKIIKFYQTPTGKKYAEKTPLIMQESMAVGQQWGMKMGQVFQEKLKAKGY